jgi:hypothetical protein
MKHETLKMHDSEVTSEMMLAGLHAWVELADGEVTEDDFAKLYRAMRAAAPEWTWDREQRYRMAFNAILDAANNYIATLSAPFELTDVDFAPAR